LSSRNIHARAYRFSLIYSNSNFQKIAIMNYLKHLHHTIKTSSPILYTIGWIHFIMGVGCIIGLLVDERNLMGVNVWTKPLKFCISGGIYILTVGYLITLYPYSKRKKNIIKGSNRTIINHHYLMVSYLELWVS